MAVTAAARDHLLTLLRERRLDRTLTTTLPEFEAGDDRAFAPLGIAAVDAQLGGGLMRGHLSEIVGARSSGRTAVLVSALAAAAARGEAVALIDPLDQFDPPSAAARGLDLSRLLWVRGQPAAMADRGRVSLARECGNGHAAIERALKAASLVMQAGNFGLVALDLAEVPAPVWRHIPFTTWLRLQRGIEGSQTVCVITASEPIARSTLGATICLEPRRSSAVRSASAAARQFVSRTVDARVVQPRRVRRDAQAALTLAPVVE
jgi:recombination protein RecA